MRLDRLLARLVALVPPPRIHMVRYYGEMTDTGTVLVTGALAVSV
jgi:hypothetical protein